MPSFETTLIHGGEPRPRIEGAVVMPISPPWYNNPESMDDVVNGFIDKVLPILGVEVEGGWRAKDLK